MRPTLICFMTATDEIKGFAREFINGQGRTAERKALIKETYRRRFGESLRVNCITCYIEAIFKIIRTVETKTCQYKLRKGVILQPFGMGIITNDNLTDEIAEEALRTRVANPAMFAQMPAPEKEPVIIPPAPADVNHLTKASELESEQTATKVKNTKK